MKIFAVIDRFHAIDNRPVLQSDFSGIAIHLYMGLYQTRHHAKLNANLIRIGNADKTILLFINAINGILFAPLRYSDFQNRNIAAGNLHGAI